MRSNSPALSLLFPALFVLLVVGGSPAAGQEAGPVFVGSAACRECHEDQYESFKKNSKKAHAWDSVKIMARKLTPEELKGCYDCHTTGHGKTGGFVSFEKTPHLADVGCETCHGPGSEHAETGDKEKITRKPDVKVCESCHNAERIENFNFKPLIYSGAH